MHILKPIYSLLLDIYWRINRDYKSPQKSIAGLFSVLFFFKRTQQWRQDGDGHGAAQYTPGAPPTGVVVVQ